MRLVRCDTAFRSFSLCAAAEFLLSMLPDLAPRRVDLIIETTLGLVIVPYYSPLEAAGNISESVSTNSDFNMSLSCVRRSHSSRHRYCRMAASKREKVLNFPSS
jgi:hypothetical protein